MITIETKTPTMTVAEFAALVQIDTSTAYKWIRSGKMPKGSVVHFGSTVRIKRRVIERELGLEEGEATPAADAS